MVLFLVIGIILGALGIDFALQNPEPITVTIFAWHVTSPLALVIFGSMLFGVLLAILVMIPAAIRESFDAYVARRELRRLQNASLAAPVDQQIA